MPNLVIAGMQWGDEGKGKIVDLICPAFDAVVRYQGGHNAGHTVKFGDAHFSLHLIPSGILRGGLECVLGNGMVIAPDAFLDELARLAASGVDATGRLFVSERATVLLPVHAELDQAREAARGEARIGTTSRGIGPAYESKASRLGLRMVDLGAPDLKDHLAPLMERIGHELESLGKQPELDLAAMAERCASWAEALAPYLASTEYLLHDRLAAGKSLLFEGAQGALLDLDHGTFPYVTSSSSVSGGATTGTGLPPTAIGGTLGVLKAYTSRVGEGPFPTELEDETGTFLRSRGNEYGTTTGRPRRCGWLDLVAARYARLVDGVDGIALTKLDVLDDLPEIRVGVGYRLGGETVRRLPADRRALEAVEPVYRTVPGWQTDTTGILDYKDLPQAARDYVELVEEELDAPVVVISTGPRREETILRDHPASRRLLGEALPRVAEERGA